MTQDIFVGRFASSERLVSLRELGVTDILNVSDTPSQLSRDEGPFRSVTWVDIEDRTLIPVASALRAIDTLHRALLASEGRVYVHCMAGWNRSPTIIWLYLLACGLDRDDATQRVCAEAFDAVPGHPLLVDSNLIATVGSHGRDNYLPHKRPSAISS